MTAYLYVVPRGRPTRTCASLMIW